MPAPCALLARYTIMRRPDETKTVTVDELFDDGSVTPATRRRILQGVATGGLVAVAGCGGGGGSDDPGDGGSSGDGTDGTDADDGDDEAEMGPLVPSLQIWANSPGFDATQAQYAEWVRDNWLDLGIDVEIITADWDGIFEALQKGEYGGVNLRWSASPERLDPDFACHFLFHSSGADSWYNISGLEDPDYDALAEEQRTHYDLEARREVVYQCQAYIAENQIGIPIVDPSILQAYRTDRFQNPAPMVGWGLNSFHNHRTIEPVSEEVTTYRVATAVDLPHTNPLAPVDTYGVKIFTNIWERLLRVSVEGEPELWAADSLEQVDDTTINITIRDDLLFHDGEDLTPEDVKFSFEYQKEHSARWQGSLEKLESVEILEDAVVQFNLVEPFAPFITRALASVWLLPRHVWEGVDAPIEFDNPVIGSGPWKFADWRPEERIVFERFDDYFAPPNIEQLVISPSTTQVMVRQLETGEIDAIESSYMTVQESMPLEGNPDIELIPVPAHDFYMFHPPSLTEPPWDSKQFRHAIAHTIPKQRIVDVLLQGTGEVTHSPIPPSNDFWHNPDVEEFYEDLDRAREILGDAGFSWDDRDRLHLPP